MNDFLLSLYLLTAFSNNAAVSPFWMTTNQWGLMPEGSSRTWQLAASTQFDDAKTWQWRWGASLDAVKAKGDAAETFGADNGAFGRLGRRDLFLDELYVSGRWKVFTLDLGMKHRDLDFMAAGENLGSMSVTGGHVIESGNTRTMPGYLITLDPVAVPFTGRHMWLYGAYGDYKTLDHRYVDGALIHRTRVFFRFDIGSRFRFHLGLDHFAQWGGVSPVNGPMPLTLDNYLRVITGRNASSSGSLSDQINVIGNQGGGELLRFEWLGEGWKAVFQHDIPYEDGSGMGFQNFPDGVNTLHFGFDDKKHWVSDILFEYQYTMWQSGTAHDRPATEEEKAKQDPNDPYYGRKIIGGCDDYFNNGEYRSGWTYYGRPIGDPLFFTGSTEADPVTRVVNNRLKSAHFALSGMLFKRMPYKVMLTFSENYGTYKKPFPTPLKQFSAAFLGETMRLKWITATYGLYFDRGDVRPNSFGFTAGVKYVIWR